MFIHPINQHLPISILKGSLPFKYGVWPYPFPSLDLLQYTSIFVEIEDAEIYIADIKNPYCSHFVMKDFKIFDASEINPFSLEAVPIIINTHWNEKKVIWDLKKRYFI